MNASEFDLTAISQALDDHDPDREHFLEVGTGALWTFVFSEATDETRKQYLEVTESAERWIRLPSMSLQEAYEEIEDFVDSLPDGQVQDQLYSALERKGALRNFREAIMALSEERQGWMVHRRERSRARLERFLARLDPAGGALVAREATS
ncbi:MAG: hypothetical protein KC591_04070 [Gemmatimonadetes bacterium]|nr:hypothetical protein [Gemmatimonadota bacterium]